nr:reverse transcriptase domain-containing protein [Tanacetum cinerariifolium]
GIEDQLSAKHQLAVKRLFECRASESNIRRIQVKNFVKEVKDYLKTNSSAGMDISLVSNPFSNPTPSTNPNPKGRNRRRSKQRIEEFNLEELSLPIVMMADQRTMAQLLQEPTEGYEDAIVVPAITADSFELKHGLLTLVQNKQFFGHDKEDPHAHIRYFNKITSTLKFSNVLNTEACDRFKDLLRACPRRGFSELHQLGTLQCLEFERSRFIEFRRWCYAEAFDKHQRSIDHRSTTGMKLYPRWRTYLDGIFGT